MEDTSDTLLTKEPSPSRYHEIVTKCATKRVLQSTFLSNCQKTALRMIKLSSMQQGQGLQRQIPLICTLYMLERGLEEAIRGGRKSLWIICSQS